MPVNRARVDSTASSLEVQARSTKILKLIRTHANIIGALVIRDVRARMGGSFFAYARVAFVPIVHLLILVATYKIMGRNALLGTDTIVFYATGMLPFMLFIYPIRSNLYALIENKPLLVYPVIFPLDIVISRILLEIINSFIVIFCIFLIFYCVGFDVLPKNPYKTLTGVFATVLFTSSFCINQAIIAVFVVPWVQICVMIGVGLYLSSGMFFLPSQMPEIVQKIMYFNPLAHCVEWIRSGYYETYKEGLLDRRYLLSVIIAQLTIGLLIERFLRGKVQ